MCLACAKPQDTVERNVCLSYMHDARKTAALAALSDAHQHNQKWVSGAEDSGTAERSALHLTQRSLNHLDMEVSDTQAAAIVLALAPHGSSETFTYCSMTECARACV